MPNDNLARLEQFPSDKQPTNAAEPLGRVVSVGGSQVMVEFSTEVLSSGETDLTVGAFLGIWNGRTLVVGSLCDISLHKLADGQQSEPATGRVDLLGRAHPRQARRRIFPARRHELSEDRQRRSCRSATTSSASSSTRPARTRSTSATCSRTPRSAPISTSTTWCASTSRSSAARAPASRARSSCCCARSWRRGRTCASC